MTDTQAVLITAYKNAEQLNNLISFFPKEEVNIYLHVDSKNKDIIDQINPASNVYIYSKYKIYWGGINHTKAILFLSEMALKQKSNVFFHLISGEDYPCVKNFSTFKQRFDLAENYLDYFDVPYKGWAGNGGLDRVNMYNPYDTLDVRTHEGFKMMQQFDYSQKFHKTLLFPRRDIRREFSIRLFGGSTWWSLSKNALAYVVEYSNCKPQLLNRFQHTFASEEFYFQTVLLNSRFSENIVNNNLRFIDWNPRGDNSLPCYLDKSDFQNILCSEKIFSRKLSLETIYDFKDFLIKNDHNESKI